MPPRPPATMGADMTLKGNKAGESNLSSPINNDTPPNTPSSIKRGGRKRKKRLTKKKNRRNKR